ncbi:MAG: DUF1223 domain-containing protein [Terriglobales bacterium]|jgi:hypothetical protein
MTSARILVFSMLLLSAVMLPLALSRAAFGADTPAATAQTPGAAPVLVELFTSEGCSSCPPADAMLAKLDSMQPVPGAQIIVMEEHVDYWNHDGWTDKYSSSAITDRQTEYKSRFKLNDVYTPEMVVDGDAQFNGSDPKAAVHAIEAARSKPKVEVKISGFSLDGKAAHLHIDAAALPASLGVRKADVYVAVALDHAESQVSKGENKGRDLKHVAVALSVTKVGTADDRAGFNRDVVVKLPSALDAGNLRVIAFVQKGDAGEVLGSVLLPVGAK